MGITLGRGSEENCVDLEALSKIDFNNPDSFDCIVEKLIVYLNRLYKDGIIVKIMYLTPPVYERLIESLGSKFTGFIYYYNGIVKIDRTS